MLIFVFWVFLVFIVIIIGRAVLKGAPKSTSVFPYVKKHSLLNRSETAFFQELKNKLPQGYYLFPQVRVLDFLDIATEKHDRLTMYYRNKIWRKSVDFLICDKNLAPVMAIEINGKSHRSQRRIDRDRFVSQVFESAKLPLEMINVGSNFSQNISRIVSTLH